MLKISQLECINPQLGVKILLIQALSAAYDLLKLINNLTQGGIP